MNFNSAGSFPQYQYFSTTKLIIKIFKKKIHNPNFRTQFIPKLKIQNNKIFLRTHHVIDETLRKQDYLTRTNEKALYSSSKLFDSTRGCISKNWRRIARARPRIHRNVQHFPAVFTGAPPPRPSCVSTLRRIMISVSFYQRRQIYAMHFFPENYMYPFPLSRNTSLPD